MKQTTTLLFSIFFSTLFGQNVSSKIDSIFQKAYTDKALNGNVLIAKNDAVLYEHSFGFADFEKKRPLSKNSLFQVASVSKQFTAFGIMVLKRQGKLAYDDKVVKYLPEFPYPDITLRHLLHHTSGLPNFWDDIRPKLDTTRSNGNNEMLAFLVKNKLPLRFESGEKWEYADIGYDLLATIIERISGQSYQKFMRKQVFRPAGMRQTEALMVTDTRRIKAKNKAFGYIQDSIKGLELAHEIRNFVFYLGDFYGDGSVLMTTRDLQKWDTALRRYMAEDSTHFGEAYRPAFHKDGSVLEVRKGVTYGFGWGVRDEPPFGKIYSHSGGHPGFVTNYYRYPDKKMVVVVCMNVQSRVALEPYLKAVREVLAQD
jgi:CubicO group peptidase (beta-lactamase class C family)